MTSTPPKRLLILEGNTAARRARSRSLGARWASEVYSDAILAHFPTVEIDVIYGADPGVALPRGLSMDAYDGLVVGGSSLHAYDKDPSVTNQIDLMRQFGETGKPVLGSCWGLQIAAMAAGGSVTPSPNGQEVLFARKLRLTEAGLAHPFLKGRVSGYDAPCIHYDEVSSLPAGTTVLCHNAHSPIQAAIIPLGKSEVWAVQYHPEFDLAHLNQLIDLYGASFMEDGFFSDADDLAAYRVKLLHLQANPDCHSTRWSLAIDTDILDDTTRRLEIINWMENCVI